ncbi:MAG: bifunctional methylenetetrahydrofolate dehydrogenase/methenyltetrahydrofolate cyclohydrolase FolD [Sphingomonadaceae bacterium]|uniref:bifunctional methylenetetrahydrofolate dehydrogenase/methenyltetrahydrofolate cyclohydrolase FolD n=1 Tax=Thermaurantiacus sp. TaxID=2820283 RepID=UPI00298EE37C|nr:bifunctional methylenetetrahydrofolate dehydrogenase/methenyltetrahydrofolate cyclohydrolase FolD [Thermaurantiacus sp.]MCS6987181.1 bifunctional methylenetetrahydrofolate dehydrogenase/methenyltetrahydrofolate cyclohydrolase FolD [Sphingomonadaceae bacterium]MDW8415785.1 bifunctional methylenetetrahydrofolate dehydrogenase/methenyltetrahydrofolate cyclohydrolase FolD [Thermaurantiacus sp.]
MILLDGRAIAAELRAETRAQVAARLAAGRRAPALAVVLAGDDPASHLYVRNKVKACREVGIRSLEHRLPADVTQGRLLALVAELNANPEVDGILVQLPLPPGCDAREVVAAIAPHKDVDGFHPLNAGRLALGWPSVVPCTPAGCLHLIERVHPDLAGLQAVVVGRSPVVGRPMASLLIARSATVTVAHSRTRDLPRLCREADILVVAAGRPELVRGDWIRQGATVIDVGINRVTGPDGQARLVGDVAFAEAAQVAGALTPVPGGVGPLTVAFLLRNTLQAAG